MSFIRPNKVPHTKVQYLPSIGDPKLQNLLSHNGTVPGMVDGCCSCFFAKMRPCHCCINKSLLLRRVNGTRDIATASARRDHRKSKFGLCHTIKLIELYGVTKSEFWFSIAWLRTSGGNVPQGRVNCQTRAARAARAACMEKIYEIPCAGAARASCASSLPIKYTILN